MELRRKSPLIGLDTAQKVLSVAFAERQLHELTCRCGYGGRYFVVCKGLYRAQRKQIPLVHAAKLSLGQQRSQPFERNVLQRKLGAIGQNGNLVATVSV